MRPPSARASVLSVFVCVLVVATGSHDLSGQTTAARARAVQWNIYYGTGTDEVYDLNRQISWITDAQPDVISLNEVTPSEAPRYQQSIQSATGVTWHSVHVVAQADGTGNQLLSKHPILTTSSYAMKTNGQYSRAVVQATINLQGRAVNLFSTHLDHADPAVRSAQIDELIAFMSRFAEPRILLGDLNARPDSAEVLKLTRSYSDAWEIARAASAASAYPPDNPVDLLTRTHRTRIDYVLYSSAAEQIVVESADVPDTRDLTNTAVRKLLGTSDDKGVRPSDHNILVLGLAVRPDTKAPVISNAYPAGTLAAGTSSTTLQVQSDEYASCRYDTASAPYSSMRWSFTTANGSSHQSAALTVQDGSSYTFYGRCIDVAANVSEEYRIFFSVAASTTPLTVSRITVSDTTTTSAILSWTTSRPATSQLEYGLTKSYGTVTAASTSPATSHSVKLTGLQPNTTYQTRAISRDAIGNQALSANVQFRTRNK